ncbi:MAG: hypothetical protein M3Y76_12020, partial [Chloroflexota bacterium]|nr:hypothetical protein [Chloroflexota bacterium]
MMSRPDDIDEKKQQQWQSRVAQERLGLSASVEESLIDASANEDLDEDELENDVPLLKSTTLIPPRLSLQSKPLPAVSTAVKLQTTHLPMTEIGKAQALSTCSFSIEDEGNVIIKRLPSLGIPVLSARMVPPCIRSSS